ncbi:MAG: hypothetical protein IJV50_09180 [Lachnospiraceae bacterium]|nr:hypothetical protein [Lachnospiraceae bacterium]
MGYVEKEKRKHYLMIGFVFMLILGFFGDAMLLERGNSSETAMAGLLNMGLGEIPMWHFMVSFFVGIPAALGYWIGTRSVWSYVTDGLAGKESKVLDIYKGATAAMTLVLFGQHTICTMGLMLLRAAILSGVSAETMTQNFLIAYMVPFVTGTLIQTISNGFECVAFVIMICKKMIPVSRAWILLSPGVLYVICMLLMQINNATIGCKPLNMLFACSESWAFGFSFLCVFFAIKKNDNF